MYIRFFNGRTSPDQALKDWGQEGPIVGSIEIAYRNADIIIYNSENEEEYEPMPMEEGLIHIEGIYYSEFEVFDNNNPLIKQYHKKKYRFMNYEEFSNILSKQEVNS